jgi:hypothetical protein
MNRRERGENCQLGVAIDNWNQPGDQSGQQKTDSHHERETEEKVFANELQ